MTQAPAVPNRRRRLRYIALLLVVICVPAAFYGWFELQSRLIADRHALDGGYANALKHAEAAASLYAALRFIGIPAERSERVIIGLGVFNEYAETYVKRGNKDTTLEMMRDLHSNMVGIGVAQWRESAQGPDRRGRSELLVALARAGVLLRSGDGIGLPPDEKRRALQSADLGWAKAWFDDNKAAIRKQIAQTLRDTRQ